MVEEGKKIFLTHTLVLAGRDPPRPQLPLFTQHTPMTQ